MDLPAVPSLLQFGQAAVYRAIRDCAADPALPSLLALDATCGNGHDCLFLARTLTKLRGSKACGLLALDVQQQALENTTQLLEKNGLASIARFCLMGHEQLRSILGEIENSGSAPKLCAGMYNLGFLPGSDKKVVTRGESTLQSLTVAADSLVPGGLLSVHAYGGHAGGREELEAVGEWCGNLEQESWKVARYSIQNKPSRPEALFLLCKKAYT